jgi:hypothetical protein
MDWKNRRGHGLIGLSGVFVVWGMVNVMPTTGCSADRKNAILAVYVDDIIITWYFKKKIKRLKECLSNEFEVKDLGNLKYFIDIEVATIEKGTSLCQWKYILDFLNDMGMTGCRAYPTTIENNHQVVITIR